MPKDTVVPIKADAPRPMSRDDRRIIFSKLEAVYLDEKRGYDEGWTDDRVAKDLGVPRAWVGTVRDENFGPVISIDVEALKAENAKLRTAITALHGPLNKMSGDLRAMASELGTMRDTILGALSNNGKAA